MKIKLVFLLFCFQYASLYAQQWIDKKYDFDSTLNVVYGAALNFNGGVDTLTMDIYTPICDDSNHVSRRPLLMWIHGGAFLAGDKNEVTNLCKQFAMRGYVTATINYRLGFISDDLAWNCNYPNYSCVFAADSAEWYRSYYRAIQDGKGALRYLINRNSSLRIDTNNVFVAGESAGAFLALGIGLLDTLIEKPIQAYAINDVPKPNINAMGCIYNVGKSFNNATIPRPDLGSIIGTIEPSNIKFNIKGIGNMYGAMMSDLLKNHRTNIPKPAIFSFHQPCDLVVPIDSGGVYSGLSWCMANGYNCFGIANTSKLYGSRAFSNWNTNYSYGYNIHDEFTSTNFPYSFLLGSGSCADQINNPCHAYDNSTLRENNLALFFAPMISTYPICDTILFATNIKDFENMNSLKIYPNPSDDVLNIEHSNCQNCSISIYDLIGKSYRNKYTLQNNLLKIDIHELNSGIYVLYIHNENGTATIKKFIKN